jgi:hypothetical protein
MLQQQEEHAFFDEVLRFLLDVDCLTEVSVDTVYRFLTAYRQITDEQSLQHTAQQLCEQLAVQSQSSHSHLISVLQRFAGAAELSNPQPLSFSIAPPAHLNPVCLIERSCHPKKIVRRIMSFAPSHFG